VSDAAFGEPHVHLESTDSTNDRCRALAEEGSPSGTIVTADEQSAGRGRHGRRWSAPPGAALLFSGLLRPLDLRHLMLPLAVPVAVCEAIESLAEVECRIKWPNDIWIGERKAAGILIEARPPEWAVIGVGINLSVADDEFPSDLRWPATSVGHGIGTEAMLQALCPALDEWVVAPEARVRDEFEARDALHGREISWSGAGEGSGVAAGIDARGNLVVELSDGTEKALGSGEVSLRLAT
jgi:BirA family biotin operon repressor/biotin-[acetyl-CoA-carboxylase] ligase